MSIESKCENCKYFIGLKNSQGHCHRYPPQLCVLENSSGRPDIRSEFPKVTPAARCGEFYPKRHFINQFNQEFAKSL